MKNNLQWKIATMVLWIFLIGSFHAVAQPVKVLCMVPNKFCETYYYNRDNMETYGWEITITGVTSTLNPDPAYGGVLGVPALTVDVTIGNIQNITDFDAVVIMMGAPWSGPACQDILNSPAALNLIREALDSGLVVAGMSTGVRVLAAADVIQGKNVTGDPTYASEYIAAGANYFGIWHMPIIDGQIVTSSDAGDYYHPENNEAIAAALERLSKKNGSITVPVTTITSDVQTDSTLWSKTYGGTLADGGKCVRPTSDGGVIIAGYTYSFGSGNADLYLIKTNSDGIEQWSKTIGGSGRDFGNEILQLADGGFLVIGTTYSKGAGDADLWLVKTDSTGNLIWDKTYGGAGMDIGKSIQVTPDGKILLLGYTESNGAVEDDIFFIKTDAAGNIIWTHTYTGDIRSDLGLSLIQTIDGNYALLGATGYFQENLSGDCNRDMFLVLTDTAGTVLWNKKYDYVNSGHTNQQFGNAICQTSDKGFLLAGNSDVFYADLLQVQLFKTDSLGNTKWSRRIGMGIGYDYGNSAMITDQKDIVVCGTTKSFTGSNNNLYCFKLNENGQLQWQQSLGSTGYEWGASVCQTTDGNYVLLGQTNSYGAGSYDVWLVKMQNTTTALPENKKKVNENRISLNPNPVKDNVVVSGLIGNVSFAIFNLFGEKVFEASTKGPEATIHCGNLPSGCYIFKIINESGIMATGKLIRE